MKKLLAFIATLAIIFLAGCSQKEQIKKFTLTNNDITIEITLNYKGEKITKYEETTKVNYSKLGLTKEDVESILSQNTITQTEGVSITNDYKNNEAKKTINVDFSKVDINKIKNYNLFNNSITNDYVDITKVSDSLIKQDFKEQQIENK